MRSLHVASEAEYEEASGLDDVVECVLNWQGGQTINNPLREAQVHEGLNPDVYRRLGRRIEKDDRTR